MIDLNSYNLEYEYDSKLKEIPKSPSDINNYINNLKKELEKKKNPIAVTRILGQIGSHYRLINQLEEAEEALSLALDFIESNQLGLTEWVVNSLRLAQVFQQKREYQIAKGMFNEVLQVCAKNEEVFDRLDFALQHSGKLYFDMHDYHRALFFFKTALELRKNKKDKILIESTKFAIKITNANIKKIKQCKFEHIQNKSKKASICEKILRKLPNWFGLEDAVLDYIEKSKENPMFTISLKNKTIGFVSLKIHNKLNCEVFVMGIDPDYHNQSYGSWLLSFVKKTAIIEGFKYLTVKTLSENRTDRFYDLTRRFYQSNGFEPFEEFKDLWDKNNPCLLMISKIR